MSDHFDLIRQRLARRQLLRAGVATFGAAALSPLAHAASAASAAGDSMPAGSSAPGFPSLPLGHGRNHALAEGYRSKTLIRWGDPLAAADAEPEFPLDASAQARRFGYNNDFIAYLPLDGSERGLLCVNHEYSIPHMMFPGYADEDSAIAQLPVESILAEMHAVGHSVVEIARDSSGWSVVAESKYHRRLSPLTSMAVDGPAAGDERLQTQQDPAGRSLQGLLGCCAGGVTPWGTVLIAEENFADVFAGQPDRIKDSHPVEARAMSDYDIGDDKIHWARADRRFDIEHSPTEFNRFGWVVELDPYNPSATPIKHTALGRCEHEGATVVAEPGKPVVVYSGDDSEDQFVYRFVSSDTYRPGDRAHNLRLLSTGTLYAARFDDSGKGEWLALQHGVGPLVPEQGFNSQADVLIDCRRAARLLGATPMDRPEDVETHPGTGRVYVALTKNKDKTAGNVANPCVPNPAGHVVELLPPGIDGARDHLANHFTWDLFLQGATEQTAAPALSNPDNIAFDARERLWISTDGCEDFGHNDGLWCTATNGPERARPRCLLRCPDGAEACGPTFTPDGRTLFVAIQHPGDMDGSSYDKPATRWPDFDSTIPPRPSVIAIERSDGKLIGD